MFHKTKIVFYDPTTIQMLWQMKPQGKMYNPCREKNAYEIGSAEY